MSRRKRWLRRIGIFLTVLIVCAGVFEVLTGLGRAYLAVYRGWRLLEDGNPAEAIAYFDRALARQPNLARAYSLRGVARHDMNDSDGAIADGQKALELDPDNDTYRTNLMRHYHLRAKARKQIRDFEGAFADYERALAIQPGDPDTLDRRSHCQAEHAVVRFNAGEWNAGIDEMRQSLTERPIWQESIPDNRKNNFRAQLQQRGQQRRKQNDLDGAVADLVEAARLNLQSSGFRNPGVTILIERAGARARRDDRAGALIDLNEAIALFPERPAADPVEPKPVRNDNEGTNELTFVVEAFGQKRFVEQDLREDRECFASVHLNRARLLFQQNDLPKAADDLITAIGYNPLLAEAYVQLMFIRLRQKQNKEVDWLVERYRRLWPDAKVEWDGKTLRVGSP